MRYDLNSVEADQGIQFLGQELFDHADLFFHSKRIRAACNFERDQLKAQFLGFLVDCLSNLHPDKDRRAQSANRYGKFGA